jgi:hypothetical protein
MNSATIAANRRMPTSQQIVEATRIPVGIDAGPAMGLVAAVVESVMEE